MNALVERALTRQDNQDLLAKLHRQRVLDHQRDDLFGFTWGAFDVLHDHRGIAFIPNFHVEAICHALTKVVRGDTRRLLITIPPRHLKTICSSVALPAFLLGHSPATKIVIACYGQILTVEILNQLRRVMESPFYRGLFPQTQFAVAGGELRTTKGGSVKFTSVQGAITGHGADVIIIDDLMKAGDATSETERDKAKDYIRNSLLSRFDDQRSGRVIAIQQRLHEDDVAANLMATGNYLHLNLPAIAAEDETIEIGNGRVYQRRKGEALYPQSQSLSLLEEMRRELGNYHFSAQYLQNPTPDGGGRIDWDVWGTYEEMPNLDDLDLIVQSWDTADSEKVGSDYSACTTWGRMAGEWYLLNVFRERLDFGHLLSRVIFMRNRWKADKVLVEYAASGRPLYTQLMREHKMRQHIVSMTPKDSKTLRFDSNIHRLEAEPFLLPQEAPWLAEFEHECRTFPVGKYDDMVDSMTQFLKFLGERRYLMPKARNGY